MANLTEGQKKAKLIIEPADELLFRGPFEKAVTTTLKLTNPSDEYILFKIKTTAPKCYCVRPNYGYVSPKGTVTVEICLQPLNVNPFEKYKHKFMIQSIVGQGDVPDDILNKYMNAWKVFPSDLIADAKLKCVFEMQKENDEPNYNKALKSERASPPKQKSEEKNSNNDAMEPNEALENELKLMREKNSDLRREISHLKEQMVRVRMTQSKTAISEPYTPVTVEKRIPMFYVAIMFACVIFGILVGKFLF